MTFDDTRLELRSERGRGPVVLRPVLGIVVLAFLLAGAVPVPAQEEGRHGQHEHAAQDAGVPLYDNLGDHHREIDTEVEMAQAYFDQGLRLQYAFNHAEAETAYRDDLARFPDNGWSLYGLARALQAQGKSDEATAVRDRFAEAWKHADVDLPSSHF